MLILGIESTCDETAASIVESGEKILSNIVLSQAQIHKKYGGVFPEVACRKHIECILPVVEEALTFAKVEKEDLDLIAVAKGPGLIGALLIGLNTAKALSLAWQKPFIGVNHVEAHLYASMMDKMSSLNFPAIGVVISGGHTLLLKILSIGKYQLIGTTVDDAIGEAFDKVAAILNLPYPGGPEVEKLAKEGDENAFNLKGGKCENNKFNFSFSGLKTSVLYTAKGNKAKKNDPLIISEKEKKNLAASFQKAAFSDLITKIDQAAILHECKSVYLGGGVSNNQYLKNLISKKLPHLNVFWPTRGLSLDNAAMIAGLAYHKYLEQGSGDPLSVEAISRIPLL